MRSGDARSRDEEHRAASHHDLQKEMPRIKPVDVAVEFNRLEKARDGSPMMSNLFFRTFSQGLQAFVPIAAILIWFHARGAGRLATATRRGMYAAVPLSILGGMAFQASTHKALDEAVLAVCAVMIALASTRLLIGTGSALVRDLPVAGLPAAAVAAALIVVRQTMEIVSVLEIATLQVRSFEATFSILSGAI